MSENVAHRSVHLWHAANAVGVLDARIVFAMRFSNFAALQKRVQMRGHSFLSLMGPGIVQPRIECGRRVAQTFERHRTGNVGYIRQAFRAQDRQSPNRVHRLSAIQQRETFFGS